jgi:hypothetical protein
VPGYFELQVEIKGARLGNSEILRLEGLIDADLSEAFRKDSWKFVSEEISTRFPVKV